MNEEELFFCSQCKQQGGFVHRDKITDFVDYPIENLDLTEFVLGPIYDPNAVSEHSGGLGGGDYTATFMNHTNSKWYSFNDSFSECSSDKAITVGLCFVLTGSFRWVGLKPLPEEDKLPDEE